MKLTGTIILKDGKTVDLKPVDVDGGEPATIEIYAKGGYLLRTGVLVPIEGKDDDALFAWYPPSSIERVEYRLEYGPAEK